MTNVLKLYIKDLNTEQAVTLLGRLLTINQREIKLFSLVTHKGHQRENIDYHKRLNTAHLFICIPFGYTLRTIIMCIFGLYYKYHLSCLVISCHSLYFV